MATLRLGGLFSGLDTDTIIQKILDVSRIPIKQFENKNTIIDVENSAVNSIKSSLSALKSSIANLKDPAFFNSNTASTSDSTVATASASASTAKSAYTFAISSIATASVLRSGTSSTDKIAHDIAPADLLTANTSYSSSLTLGTFTINGATITIDGTDTLNSTFAKISAATSGVVTGSIAGDKITLTSASNIVLGAGGDTSNFLSRSRLYTNGTGTIASLTTIGTIDPTQVIGDANSGILNSATLTTGDITINGVSIAVDKDTDTLQNVLDRISASSANVYASYDSIEDRIVLTSKTTGSTGIAISDGTSNFASKLKLTTATSSLTTGNNTTFTVNGGVTRVSTDSVISDVESGVTGLTVTALKAGTSIITVSSDSTTVNDAVTSFVSQYNSVINQIKSFTAIPTETTKPTDSASILTGDSIVSLLANDLRRKLSQSVGTGTYRMLADLGITTSSSSNSITFSDPSKLSSALATNLDEVQDIFSAIGDDLSAFIDTQVDTTTGAFSRRSTNLLNEKADNKERIDQITRSIDQEENRLVTSFSSLEEFQAKSQSILQFLQTQKNK